MVFLNFCLNSLKLAAFKGRFDQTKLNRNYYKKQENYKNSVRKTLDVREFSLYKNNDPSKQTSNFYIYYFTPV